MRTCLLVQATRTALTCAAAILTQSSIASTTWTWGPSGDSGGGFQNVMAIQPGGTGVIISGADVAGFQRSSDFGVTWAPCNIGAEFDNSPHVATVVFSDDPNKPNVVYAGIGTAGKGSIVVSPNAGISWKSISSQVGFSGNGESSIAYLPNRNPRSTGHLIAVNESGSFKAIYAGTFSNGVWRSVDSGTNWTCAGLNTSPVNYIRSIVLDPNNSNILYATSYSNQLWKCTSIRTQSDPTGTNGWTHLTDSSVPNKIEELFMIGANLYAVGTDDSTHGGVWKSINGGSTFTKMASTTISNTATYTGINGYSAGGSGADVVYISATFAASDGAGSRDTILKSTDSGSTWKEMTKSADIVNAIGGAGGPSWWLSTASAGNMLGGSGCDEAMVQIDPNNHDRVMVSGRAGVWGTTNASDTTSLWYPMVSGMSVTVINGVATDPSKPERMYLADEDYRFLYSTNHGAYFFEETPAPGNGNDTTGFSIYTDPLNGKVYLGEGNRDANSDGIIVSDANPASGGNGGWSSEGSPGGGDRPLGLIVGRDSGNNVTILAAIEGAGIYRKSGGGSWVLETNGIKPTEQEHVQFAWNQGSQYVYCYEPGTTGSTGDGVWRSPDYGVSWTKIWNHAESGSSDGPGSVGTRDWLVEDPNKEGRLYISSVDGVWRMTNAQTGTVEGGTINSPVDMGGPAKPGPLAIDGNGVLYACDEVTDSTHTNAHIFRWATPATSTTSSDISDSVFYPGQAGWMNGLVISSDNYLYGACNNVGAIVGIPSGSGTPPTCSIISPADNTAYAAPANITFNVSATDSDGTVASVTFMLNGTQVAQDFSSPFTFTTNGVPEGAYHMKAIATDNDGLSTTSSIVDVTVSNLPPMVAWFPLEEGAISLTTNITHAGAGGYSGFFSNAPTWITSALPPVPAALGGTVAAVNFNASASAGTDPYIITTFPGVLSNSARTIAAWINASNSQPNNGSFISYGDSAVSGHRMTLRLDTTNTFGLRVEAQGAAAFGSIPLNDNAWHHVAMTFPSSGTVADVLIYVDGNPDTVTAINGTTVINTTNISSQEFVMLGNGTPNTNTYGFNGSIDDVRFYTNQLSATQIQQLVFSSNPHLLHSQGQVSLSYSQQPGGLMISWPNNWVLQMSPVLNGDPSNWVDVPEAASPFTVPTESTGTEFFRLRSP